MSATALAVVPPKSWPQAVLHLVEKGEYDAMASRYLEGGCLAFAYALWLAHGCPPDATIAILSNDMGEPCGDFDHEATHAYLDLGEITMDVRGARTVADMAEEFDLDDEWRIADYLHPDAALEIYAGGFMGDVEPGDYPIELYQDDMVDALVHIAEHPERYGIS